MKFTNENLNDRIAKDTNEIINQLRAENDRLEKELSAASVACKMLHADKADLKRRLESTEQRANEHRERLVELENDALKSKEIMGECWGMVGNDIDFQNGGYNTPHEHVNALKQRAEAAERELDKANSDLLSVFALSTLSQHEPTFECGKEFLKKFAIEQQIKVLEKVLELERFELDLRPMDLGIRVECIEIMIKNLEVEASRGKFCQQINGGE